MLISILLFIGATFFDIAYFRSATFSNNFFLTGSQFEQEADFVAINAELLFDIQHTVFMKVPDFNQAHFAEAPRLDKMEVTPPRKPNLTGTEEAYELAARWRVLKRLAIQAHDNDRELEFNAQEIQVERAASGWPIPNKEQGWKSWLRFFFGWLYGFFSNYGRSLVRPFVAWFIGILMFAAFYLSQTGVMQRDLALKDAWWGSAAAQAGHYAVANMVPCYAREAIKDTTSVGGLTEEVRSQTNALSR